MIWGLSNKTERTSGDPVTGGIVAPERAAIVAPNPEDTATVLGAGKAAIALPAEKPSPRARRCWCAIHGINTDADDVRGWVERFKYFVERTTPDVVLTALFEASEFNTWRKQKKILADLEWSIRQWMRADDVLSIVSHSYGGKLSLRLLEENPMLKARELHLIASAAEPDCSDNGLNTIADRNQAECVRAYISNTDEALEASKMDNVFVRFMKKIGVKRDLGFGNFGQVGPQNMNPRADAITRVIPYHGLKHSQYFGDEYRDQIFTRVLNCGYLPTFTGAGDAT